MINVGILGTGNIGTDLLLKLLKHPFVKIIVFSGRRLDSKGIKMAIEKGVNTSVEGINYFKKRPNCCDLIFECTNAIDAVNHAKVFVAQKIKVIDLTPAELGELCVPNINPNAINQFDNINMITCGGQASIPLLHLISKCAEINYIEIVSQIASNSAGMGTRMNVDNYIERTESAIEKFTGCKNKKVILNLNPAEPFVDMQTTMFIKFEKINNDVFLEELQLVIKELKEYIPYYSIVMSPIINNKILTLGVKVKGSGDYLPAYAGNLDIINCAAIEVMKNIKNE